MMATIILLKRIYEAPEPSSGLRILVDGLWPRGISKNEAKLDGWFKEVAPSAALRKWYGHEVQLWNEFKEKYFKELDEKRDAVQALLKIIKGQKVTFLFAAKEERHCNAVALLEYLTLRELI